MANIQKKGIDVSDNNSTLDFSKLKNEIDFAIIRLGYGGDYAKQDDEEFLNNVKGCEKHGIPYGVYLYSYALTVDNAKSEVAHTLRLLKKCTPTYGVWFDMEDADGYKKKHGMPSGSMLVSICETFCKAIEDAGYYTGIYASLSWLENQLASTKLDRFDKWVAQWNSTCEYKKSYSLWQYTSDGKLPGHICRFDMNYCYKDFAASKAPEKPAKPSKFKEYNVVVTASSGLNCRKGASTKHDIITAYTKGAELTIVAESGGWGRTNRGWVSLEYTKKVTASHFKSYKARVLPAVGLNYRSGPGVDYKLRGVYPYGTTLTITQESKGWGKTSKGWVSLAYTKKV